jgi:hypothetical protein
MTSQTSTSPLIDSQQASEPPPNPKLSEAARRALAEAHERRTKTRPPLPPEINGRAGPEPVRYGDWEVKGVATDF